MPGVLKHNDSDIGSYQFRLLPQRFAVGLFPATAITGIVSLVWESWAKSLAACWNETK